MRRYVTHYYPRAFAGNGGVTHAVWLWTAAMQSADIPVRVLYDGRQPRSADAPIRSGVRSTAVAHAGRGRSVHPRDLAAPLGSCSILVLHSGYVLANLVAARAARRHDVPYVVVPHGAYDPHLRGHRRGIKLPWETAERRMLENAAAVHVFFEHEREHVLDLAPRARVLVAATGYEPVPGRWRFDPAEDYVAWLGRFDVRHKGIDRLLDAIALIPPQRRPCLRMHGRDSQQSRHDVQRLVDDRQLGDHVIVGPPVGGNAKTKFLLGARAYVHSSRWECHSVALVENLAHGVPALVTSDIGIAATLRRSDAALVVDGSAAGLAAGLNRLRDIDLAAIGDRGRTLVRATFSHEAAAKAWTDGLGELGVGEATLHGR